MYPNKSFWVFLLAFLILCSCQQQESQSKTKIIQDSNQNPTLQKNSQVAEADSIVDRAPEWTWKIEDLDSAVRDSMVGVSWKKGCPVPLEKLRRVWVVHWDMEQNQKQGLLVVHKKLANETLEIFRSLYEQKFPIQSMLPIIHFQANDSLSMAANNSSAFNCRRKTVDRRQFSRHSWGSAIDINPIQNPFVYRTRVSPQEGRSFLKCDTCSGVIRRGDQVVQTFRKQGWLWGGYWRRSQDYQHFQKKAFVP